MYPYRRRVVARLGVCCKLYAAEALTGFGYIILSGYRCVSRWFERALFLPLHDRTNIHTDTQPQRKIYIYILYVTI
jgi:hypothetical protein